MTSAAAVRWFLVVVLKLLWMLLSQSLLLLLLLLLRLLVLQLPLKSSCRSHAYAVGFVQPSMTCEWALFVNGSLRRSPALGSRPFDYSQLHNHKTLLVHRIRVRMHICTHAFSLAHIDTTIVVD